MVTSDDKVHRDSCNLPTIVPLLVRREWLDEQHEQGIRISRTVVERQAPVEKIYSNWNNFDASSYSSDQTFHERRQIYSNWNKFSSAKGRWKRKGNLVIYDRIRL